MRILITSPIFPPDLGGPSTYVPTLGRWLVERGHEVRVVAFCSDPNPSGYPFEVTAIPRGFLPWRYLRSFLAQWRQARWADVVYVNEHLALLPVLAAKLRRKPVCIRVMVDGSWEIAHRRGWTSDDIDTFQGRDYGLRVRLVRTMQRWWWAKADAVVCVSDYLRRIVAGHGVEAGKLHRIHNAYNGPRSFPLEREEARRRLGLPADRRIVTTVCRLMVWKGVDGVLEALAGLPEDVMLVVVGDGAERDAWRALAERLGVADRVVWAGERSHEETLAFVRASDLFVLNSRYEGLSHTLLEVMFLGVPIVCTSVCGNPELVRDGWNGLLVPPGDPERLRGALASLLDDPERSREFGRRSMEKVRDFDRERLFGRLEALLEELAAGRIPQAEPQAAEGCAPPRRGYP